MSVERTLLVGMVLAAVPFLRGGLSSMPVGETNRQAMLRAAIRESLFAIGGSYANALPPGLAPLSNDGLARAFLRAALDACDDLGLPRSEVVAAINAHARTPAPLPPRKDHQ
ncbi:MAG: hypothetical protein J0H82_30295 [Alphaproteobacteria bacterium]|nr:hypothetical protein [Alphaproteobacteria bacterium]